MENEISVLVGLAVVAGVFYFYKKKDKKSDNKTTYSKPVAEKNQPKRGPGSTPKTRKHLLSKTCSSKKTVAKKTTAKKAAPKKSGPKKGSAKPNLQVK